MRRLHILLTPEGSNSGYRLVVSGPAQALLLLAVILLMIALIMAAVLYTRMALVAGRARGLELENQTLKIQMDRVASLKDEVDRLRSFEAKMLTIMGIDTLGLGRLRYEEAWMKGRRADSLRATRPDGGFVWPVRGPISRGYRTNGGAGVQHPGLDIAGETGAFVKAAARGKVVFAGVDSILGNMIVLEHEGGLSTVYGHNSQLLVKVGALVKKGESIARLGSTGRSSAPHLHFEVREGGDAVDPYNYLQTD